MIINKYIDGTKVIRNFFIMQKKIQLKKNPIWSSIYYMTGFCVGGSLYSSVSLSLA